MSEVHFGRYLLERRLAMGGMAEVFLARIEGPEGFAKKVVIKRILPHLQEDPEHVRMFLDEAKLAARFNHPNLVQVYELAKLEGQYCLAMEYIEGEDVASILDISLRLNKKTPFEVISYVIAGAAEGLHYVHELTTEEGEPLHVVHRDISPANIIVTSTGGVKIVDFGIAKHEVSSSKTSAGTLKGKFAYMSPEQARGEKVDRRSDIFSLGIICYELITVSPCFTGNTQMEILDAVTQVRYRPARELRPDLPAALERVLKRMLSPRPEQRFQSAAEVGLALHQFMSESRVPSAADVSQFLARLFGRGPRQGLPRVRTAIQDFNEVPVSGEFSSPAVIADEASYERMASASVEKGEQTWSETRPLPQERGAFEEPSGRFRRSTFSRLADRLREPRYWPTTIAIIGVSMTLAGLALAMVYRAALGMRWQIVGDVIPSVQEPTADEELPTGSLEVVTAPDGAAVSIDNEVQEGRTPLTISNLTANIVHRVQVSVEGREPVVRDVVLSGSGLETLSLVLPSARAGPGPANVQVVTTPAGARVVVDSIETTYVTPATVRLEAGRSHVIAAHLEGYASENVTVTPKEPESVVTVPLTKASEAPSRPTLAGEGFLDLDSEPPADVFLAGRRVGSTPLVHYALPAGSVVVELRDNKLGFSKFLRLNIAADGTLRRRVVVRKGQVVFDVRPWADVYLGKKKLGTTPMPPLALYEGTYAVKLSNPELGVDRVVQVAVRPGKLRKVVEKLK